MANVDVKVLKGLKTSSGFQKIGAVISYDSDGARTLEAQGVVKILGTIAPAKPAEKVDTKAAAKAAAEAAKAVKAEADANAAADAKAAAQDAATKG